MVTFNVAAIPEGHSRFETEVSVQDVDLSDSEEFTRSIHIVYDCNKIGDEVFITTLLSTAVDLTCDVCLDQFQLHLKEKVEIVLTTDSELVERDEEDIYLITDASTNVDITDSIRQTLVLAIPFKKKCKETCKGLCETCGANLNYEQCSCSQTKIDPRWQGLKNISFDDE